MHITPQNQYRYLSTAQKLSKLQPPMATVKRRVATVSGFALSCLVAASIQIFFFSPISRPLPLLIPLPSSLSQFPTENFLIQDLERLGEGFLKDPEDVCFDSKGVLYTATRDGWIKRLTNQEDNNASWENWKMLNSSSLLGITAARDGSIVVCDAEEGLLKVEEDRVTVLLSYVNGTKLRFADDVIEAVDGSLYFSVASTKFGFHDWFMDVLEARPHGQLLRYEPSLNRTTLVLDNLRFANGVAISKDQDFLVICESWRFRCLKHWLTGDSAGKTEVFVENLPGAPDNINLAPDGSFWISLLQVAREGWEFVHTSIAAKHLVATFPRLAKMANGAYFSRPMVVNVGVDGSVLRKIEEDSQGNHNFMSFVTSAVEFQGHLYLGSLNSNFVAKLPLKKQH